MSRIVSKFKAVSHYLQDNFLMFIPLPGNNQFVDEYSYNQVT